MVDLVPAMILLDTRLVLWAALQPQRLPARVAKLLGWRDADASRQTPRSRPTAVR